ncbi:hypothetical protein L1887_06863 [Cichorium endivia]|nr:hypothetical protein L1887_06863 [Cichorium endivia]
MELATKEALDNATEWIGMNFIPGGRTNMSIALDQAVDMLSGIKQSVPFIFFIKMGISKMRGKFVKLC